MLQYKAINGQSLLDICLNTYGSLDFLTKLIQDNGIENANYTPFSGQSFVWDELLTVDQSVNQQSQNSGIIYATKEDSQSHIILKSGSMETTILGSNEIGTPGGSVVPSVVLPMYIGSVDNLNPSESQVKAMDVINSIKANQSKVYTIDFKRPCFSYPANYGLLSSVKDQNGFEILSGFVKTVQNFTIDGQLQSYTIYTLVSATTQTNYTITYTFQP